MGYQDRWRVGRFAMRYVVVAALASAWMLSKDKRIMSMAGSSLLPVIAILCCVPTSGAAIEYFVVTAMGSIVSVQWERRT